MYTSTSDVIASQVVPPQELILSSAKINSPSRDNVEVEMATPGLSVQPSQNSSFESDPGLPFVANTTPLEVFPLQDSSASTPSESDYLSDCVEGSDSMSMTDWDLCVDFVEYFMDRFGGGCA